MPSDKPDKVEKWRHPVSAVQTLSGTAFAQMVMEHGLRVVGPSSGYLYAALETDDGHDMFRTFAGWETVAISTTATANPAAGAQLATVTVPAGKRHLLLSGKTSVVTDANVANRYFILVIKRDGTNTDAIYAQGSAITASLTRSVSFSNGLPGTYISEATSGMIIGTPDRGIEIPAGGNWQLFCVSIQAADDIAALQYAYKEVDA